MNSPTSIVIVLYRPGPSIPLLAIVDWLRRRGGPDLCRPMGADDFVCD